MNSEIELPNFESALKTYTEKSDLVESYNSDLAKKFGGSKNLDVITKKTLYHRDLFNSSSISSGMYLAGGISTAFCSGGLVLASNFLTGYNGIAIAVTSMVTFAVGYCIGFPLTYQAYKLYDNFRLKKYAKSNKQHERNYYTNRVLYSLLAQKASDADVFDNHFILGYSLWLYEQGRELRALGKNREYRKLFGKVNMSDFIRDQATWQLYVNLAKDMNSGVFDRCYIPLAAYNRKEFRMFKKYGGIIAARKDSGSSSYQTSEEKDHEQQSKNSFKWKTERENQEKRDREELKQKLEAQKEREWEVKSNSDSDELKQLISKVATLEDDSLEDISNMSSKKFENDVIILKNIENEWIATQSDIVQLLKYPLFSDMSESLVKEFHTRLSFAKSLSAKTLDNDFVLAVSSLSTAWDSLVHEAHRIELSKFDNGERKKIILAKKLMDIALNSASTASERQSAYKKAMEQLKGLVVLPKAAIAVIEQSVSRAELVS